MEHGILPAFDGTHLVQAKLKMCPTHNELDMIRLLFAANDSSMVESMGQGTGVNRQVGEGGDFQLPCGGAARLLTASGTGDLIMVLRHTTAQAHVWKRGYLRVVGALSLLEGMALFHGLLQIIRDCQA